LLGVWKANLNNKIFQASKSVLTPKGVSIINATNPKHATGPKKESSNFEKDPKKYKK